jgi:integrase
MDAAASSRDRAFLAIGIYTFMRAGEITSLKIGDIDLERSELRIYRFKTQQNDRLPICLELQAELSAWLAIYRSRCGDLDPSWYLCPSQGPTPMKGVEGERRLIPTGGEPPLKPTRKITQPQRIVKHAMAVLNVGGKGDGCHVLRRSGARALYEQLRDLGHDGAARRVQSMLGHASMLMTEKYLGLDHERSQRNEMLAGRSMFGPARSPIGSSSPLALEASPMPHL